MIQMNSLKLVKFQPVITGLLEFIRFFILSFTPGGKKLLLTEIYMLRRQLILLKREQRLKRCPKLKTADRLFFAICAQFISRERLRKLAIVVNPKTILKFHRALVKRKYHQLYSNIGKSQPGPKGPSDDLIKLVVEVKRRNSHMGCPQIADFINNNFDFTISKSTVRRILKRHFRPDPNDDSPSWLSLIGNCTDNLWSIDFFKVESVFLKTYTIMIVMDQYSRKIIGITAERGCLDARQICRMFNEITTGLPPPKHLSMDNDQLFKSHLWKNNLKELGIRPIHSVPEMPWTHPYIESLIGTTRRELTDRMLFANRNSLNKKLNEFSKYYNEYRVHSSIDRKPPLEFAGNIKKQKLSLGSYHWKSHCYGLFQVPVSS